MWISVKEKLPKQGVPVLAYDSQHRIIGEAQHWTGSLGWVFHGPYEGEYCVTHWQPLPAPPGQEETQA